MEQKMLVQLAIIFALLYETGCMDSTVIGSPANQHGNNMISKDEYAPMKISTPLATNKKMPSTIIHPLHQTKKDLNPQESFHLSPLGRKKTHDDFLNHEIPILLTKLQQHYAAEELRQKRTELKEKWRRYNKLMTQKDKYGDDVEAKHPETPYVMERQVADSNSPMYFKTKKGHIINRSSDMYVENKPPTRRILEYKDEEQSLDKNPKLFHAGDSEHPSRIESYSNSTSTTHSTINENIESNISTSPEEPPKYELNPKQTTESHFNPVNHILYGPYIPMMPAMYWPKGTTTESTISSKN